MADQKHTLNEIPVEKTMLAKLFARENISVVHSNVKTAMFDTTTRTMYLPYWKNVDLNMYDMLVAHETGHALETPLDGFHENNKVYKGLIRQYLNIVEDARIEKLQLRRYPGLKNAFTEAYKSLMDRNFFVLKGELPLDKQNLEDRFLGDRINLYFKLGRWGHLNVPFKNDKELDILKRVSLAETFDEVRALAKEIMEYDKAQYQKQKKQQEQDGEGEGKEKGKNKQQKGKGQKGKGQKSPSSDSSDGEGDSDSDSEGDDGEEGSSSGKKGKNGKKDGKGKGQSSKKEASDADEESDTGDGSGDDGSGDEEGKSGSQDGEGDTESEDESNSSGSGDESGDSDSENESENSNQDGGSPSNGFGRNLKDSPVSDEEFQKHCPGANASDRAYHQAMEDLTSVNNFQDVIICNLPIVDEKKVVISSQEVFELFEKFMLHPGYGGMPAAAAKEKALEIYTHFRQKYLHSVNYLIKEFDLRKAADEHKRTTTTRMGDLNLSKIHSYKFNEDIFRRVDQVQEGKCHAFVMLLDMSGSMSSVFHKTMIQLLILVEFCHRLNIPFEVYGFVDNQSAISYVHHKNKALTIKENVNDIVLHGISRFAMIRLIDSSIKDRKYRQLVGYLLSYSCGVTGGTKKKMYLKDDAGRSMPLEDIPEFGLSGTPLIEAMYVMPNLIKKFKEKSGAQIVHFFNLTDGMGGYIGEYYDMVAQQYGNSNRSAVSRQPILCKGYNNFNSYSGYNKQSTRTKVIFNDLQTKKIYEYKFDENQKNNLSSHTQHISMNLLSRRIAALGCNVININLLGSNREMQSALERCFIANEFFYTKTKETKDAIKKTYMKEGFAKCESSIFTHEFFMATNTTTYVPEYSADGQTQGTVTQMKNEIMKEMKENLNTRLLAIEFSKLISQ